MNLVRLSAAYMRARPLNTILNVLLLAMSVAVLTILVLASEQIEERLTRDARDISLVVGAKGSPLQLVLSAVFHVDVPPGNIKLADASAVSKMQHVKRTVPLALGDTFRGFRIAGTTHDLLSVYGAKLSAGRTWQAPMEAVIGAEVAQRSGLSLEGKFSGTHGLGAEGDAHDATPYKVVGIVGFTGSVLDRLVLTSVESVWVVHMHLRPDEKPDEAINALTDDEKEITALLVQYGSPLGAVTLPRAINQQTNMQAASPAAESARLFALFGVALDVVRGFAIVLMLAAGLSTFIALYNALEERRYDLAVMRMLGASPGTLVRLVLMEGALLAVVGALLGLLAGHLLTEVIGAWLALHRQPAISGLTLVPAEALVAGAAVVVGLVAAMVPAWRAYRRDVAQTLSQG
ncbi:MAG: ABC transporter permease [Burkholderiales bacterium]